MGRHIVLYRWGGLGDVCMALAAAKALVWAGHEVSLVTAPEYHNLARACPHLSGVYSQWPGSSEDKIDLGGCRFGTSHLHQVDAYLEACGVSEARRGVKTLDLYIQDQVSAAVEQAFPGDGWVVLHPSVGDPNRTWPATHWAALARRLQEDGHRVLAIGSVPGEDGKGAVSIAGVQCAFGMTPLETVALLHRSKMLVSCDSGPIQLAGATQCSVVGLYSVVSPAVRLPFRGTWLGDVAVPCYCPHSPCYRKILDPSVWGEVGAPQGMAGIPLGRIFAHWCLLGDNSEPFACMKGLAVQTVHAAINGVLA